MDIQCFEDLLKVARVQPDPQRLLFVFAAGGLPEQPTAEQRAGYEAGEGGELAPLMCADKAVEELTGFDALVAESALAGPRWAIVFTAALSGTNGCQPAGHETQAALQHMVDSVKAGRLDGMLPFNRAGEPVRLT